MINQALALCLMDQCDLAAVKEKLLHMMDVVFPHAHRSDPGTDFRRQTLNLLGSIPKIKSFSRSQQ